MSDAIPRHRKLLDFRSEPLQGREKCSECHPWNRNNSTFSKICVLSSALQQPMLALDMVVSVLQVSVPPLDVYFLLQPVVARGCACSTTKSAPVEGLFNGRTSECLGMKTFFRGIRKSVLSLFCGIFLEQSSGDYPH